jgi:hypothetical protein
MNDFKDADDVKDGIRDMVGTLSGLVDVYVNRRAGDAVYSVDKEYFNHEDLDEIVVDEVCAKGFGVGDSFTVWRGVLEPCRASQFVNLDDIDGDDANQAATFDVGDIADDWLTDITGPDANEFIRLQNIAVDIWAILNGHHPNFWQVGDVAAIRVELTEVPEQTFDIKYKIVACDAAKGGA